MQIARDANLDLVEIASTASPPVCKVMDMGKFLFEQTKKDRQARKSQTKVEIKEIRLRPKTNVHHRGFKVRDARRWLEDGMKVKVTIRFRGREITYPEIALEDLREIAEDLREVSTVEVAPSMEARSMTLVLAPIKAPAKKAEKPAAREKAPEEKEAGATPQAEAEAETKAEAKAEVKAESEAEVKAEAEADTKAEVKAETKAEVKSEAKAEVKAEAKAAPQESKES